MTNSSGIEVAAPHNWPNLWSRDGFLGTNSVVLRDQYLPDFKAISGPHVPRRFNIADVVTADLTDPEAMPTPVLTSREGLEFSVSRRRQPMPYALRSADAEELHFIQSGALRFETDFGSIDAGPLDFVLIPRAVAYRVVPLDAELSMLIMSSPAPLNLDTPAPLGMIYRGRSLRHPTPSLVTSPAPGPFRLKIKSYDGVSEFQSAEDPLPGIALIEGPCPIWALNLREINPLTYGGPGGPPGQFLTSPDTAVMSYSLSSRPGGRPPVHVNADYDELILYAAGPGAWGAVDTPGTFTFVPKSVVHHGPDENVPEGYEAWLIEVRPTMRLSAEALAVASPMETSHYGID